MFKGVHQICTNNHNKVDLALFCVMKEHYKLYSKFGGVHIEKSLEEGYGKINRPFFILSWEPTLSSHYFKKVFLK